MWQVTNDPSSSHTDHNLQLLPPKSSMHFFRPDCEMLDEAKSISMDLEKEEVVTGAYQAMLDLKPTQYRLDLFKLISIN